MADAQEVEVFGEQLTDIGVASNLDTLQNEIKDEGLWKDFFTSSTGETILELLAFVGAKFRYMILIEARESYPTRAQRRSSVIEGFKILDYNPDRRVASDVDVRFYLDNAHTKDILIPRFTQLTHDSGKDFVTVEKGVLNKGETEIKLHAKQATYNEIVRTSNGGEHQEFNIDSSLVAEDGVFVFVGGDEWGEIDSLVEALRGTGDFESYEIKANPDETLVVRFGDGSQGAVPDSGKTIRIVYLETEGSDGAIYGNDTITTIESTIQDFAGNDVDDLQVTNDDRSATGGEDLQSLEEIKRLAPKVFKAGDRAVTNQDFQVISEDYPSVLLANVVGERNADPPNAEFADKLELYLVREKNSEGVPQPVTDSWAFGTSTTASLENPDDDTFLSFLNTKKELDTVVEPLEPEQVWHYVSGTVWVDSTVSPSAKKQDIQDELDELLLGEKNSDRGIGDPVRESIVSDNVDDVSGVTYHHVDLVQFANNIVNSTSVTFGYNDFSYGNRDFTIIPPIRKESVEIIGADGRLVAEDDGEGNLVAGPNETNFTSGSVDYRVSDISNWKITLNHSSPPDELYKFNFLTAHPEGEDVVQEGDLRVSGNQYAIYDPDKTSNKISIELDFSE